MKAKLFLLVVVLFNSCTNENKSLTSAEKDKIVDEAEVLVNTVIQACETPDPDKLKSTYLNSPDFVSAVGGVYVDYEASVNNMYAYLNSVSSQKSTIKSEKYVVLDPATVLYSMNSRWETKTKNDSTVVMDPVCFQLVLKKIDKQWKVLSWTEVF